MVIKRIGILLLLCGWLSGPAGTPLPGQEATAEEPGFLQRVFAALAPKDPLQELQDSLTAAQRLLRQDEGVRQQYSLIYNLIHQQERNKYRNLSDSGYIDWDTYQQLSRDARYVSRKGDTIRLARDIKVFGWHPHWMGSAYKSYNFRLLSHVALFSYNINTSDDRTYPYDNPEVINEWVEGEDFDLIDRAHADSCKVLITITNFGQANNRKFLQSTSMQDEVISDLMELLKKLEADGIDVDFEDIPNGLERQFSTFIRKLRDALSKGQQLLTVVLPKVNDLDPKIYNMDALQEEVDFFVLTGYDFTAGPYPSGPIAPLYNEDREKKEHSSIEDVVYNYLQEGVAREKLLLGLPYYGGKWSLMRLRQSARDTALFEHLTYRNIRDRYASLRGPEYDEDRWGAFYRMQEPENSLYTAGESLLWFDDTLTLGVKYDWVIQQKLGGIGIWALGYDHPYPELWNLIDRKFAPLSDTRVLYRPTKEALYLPQLVFDYRQLIAVSGLFIFLFLTIGFILALFDWRVREVFFTNKVLRLLYIATGFAVITATFSLFLFLRPGWLQQFGLGTLVVISLVAGLLLGPLITRFVDRLFKASRDKLP